MASTKLYIAAGAAIVIAGAGAVLFGVGGPSIDTGGGGSATLAGTPPKLDPNTLDAVGGEEASRRATLNDRKAQEAIEKAGESYVAQPVIAEEVPLGKDGPLSERPPEGIEMPKIKNISASEIKVPEKIVVTKASNPQQDAQAQAERERVKQENDRRNAAAQRVQEQIDQLLANNVQPNINIQGYKAPEKSEKQGGGGGTSGPDNARAAGGGTTILAAKPGDVFYASLKVGFNSDDPRGLPVYATVTDQRADGSFGPLHGSVLAGNVTYSNEQAAVTFKQMTLRDGRTAGIQAMAATLDEVRPGVATTVDKHTLSRYSGLLAASLLQGIGSVGKQLVANDATSYVSDGTVIVSGANSINWAKTGLAAVEPLGNNLAAAMSKSFNRQPTISSSAGSEVAVVFLQQITIAATK